MKDATKCAESFGLTIWRTGRFTDGHRYWKEDAGKGIVEIDYGQARDLIDDAVMKEYPYRAGWFGIVTGRPLPIPAVDFERKGSLRLDRTRYIAFVVAKAVELYGPLNQAQIEHLADLAGRQERIYKYSKSSSNPKPYRWIVEAEAVDHSKFALSFHVNRPCLTLANKLFTQYSSECYLKLVGFRVKKCQS